MRRNIVSGIKFRMFIKKNRDVKTGMSFSIDKKVERKSTVQTKAVKYLSWLRAINGKRSKVYGIMDDTFKGCSATLPTTKY